MESLSITIDTNEGKTDKHVLAPKIVSYIWYGLHCGNLAAEKHVVMIHGKKGPLWTHNIEYKRWKTYIYKMAKE